MNNKKPIEIIKNYNLKPLSIYEKDGGFGMTIQENIISQIVEARDEECYNFLIKQIQNFIVKNNIETCFVINKEEMVDCLQEHNKLYCEIKDLQHQLDQQKSMWNELKEWLEEEQTTNKRLSKSLGNTEYNLFASCIEYILFKMLELEGEDEQI